jgi:hypothetical protein
MKKTLVFCLTAIIFLSAELIAKDKIRVGVFDSRAVAIWYFRSDENKKVMQDLFAERTEAVKKGDSALVKKINEKGPLLQRIAHDKGFGRGSVAEILEKHSDVIKELGKKEKLSLILSKWEVNYSAGDVELVDITLKLLDILKAPEDVKKMMSEIDKHKPVENAFFIED